MLKSHSLIVGGLDDVLEEEKRLIVCAFRRLNIIQTTDIKTINANLLRMKNNNDNKKLNYDNPKIDNFSEKNKIVDNNYQTTVNSLNLKLNSSNDEHREVTDRRIFECYSKLLAIVKKIGLRFHEDLDTMDIRNLRVRISQMEVQLTLLGIKEIFVSHLMLIIVFFCSN